MFSEQQNAEDEGACCADPSPRGVGRADGNAFLRQPEEPGAHDAGRDGEGKPADLSQTFIGLSEFVAQRPADFADAGQNE